MTAEEIWRRKSDEELVAASSRLGEYNEAGQRAITTELLRRQQSGALSDIVTAGTSAGLDDAGHLAENALRPRQGVIVSLWRGAVPLRITFWVCGVLTNLLWTLAIGLAYSAGHGGLMVLLASLHLFYYTFIVVAIWRSAGRYTGNRIWGDLARLSIALGLIRTVGVFFTGA